MLSSINDATTGIYPPFLKLTLVKATVNGPPFLRNKSSPFFPSNITPMMSPGPQPSKKLAPCLFDPFLNDPKEQQANPLTSSLNALPLNAETSDSLKMPILKWVPLVILISQQANSPFCSTWSAQRFLQGPTDVVTSTVERSSSENWRDGLGELLFQFRYTKCLFINQIIIETYSINHNRVGRRQMVRYHFVSVRIIFA